MSIYRNICILHIEFLNCATSKANKTINIEKYYNVICKSVEIIKFSLTLLFSFIILFRIFTHLFL